MVAKKPVLHRRQIENKYAEAVYRGNNVFEGLFFKKCKK